jgi:glucose-6-phosphate 1-dehydrogenase
MPQILRQLKLRNLQIEDYKELKKINGESTKMADSLQHQNCYFKVPPQAYQVIVVDLMKGA